MSSARTLVGVTVVVLAGGCATAQEAAPAATDTRGETAVEALSEEERYDQSVRQVLGGNVAMFQECYERQLVMDAQLGGELVYEFKINIDGEVERATLLETTMENMIVERCVEKALRALQFDSPPRSNYIVTYPFDFKSTRGVRGGRTKGRSSVE